MKSRQKNVPKSRKPKWGNLALTAFKVAESFFCPASPPSSKQFGIFAATQEGGNIENYMRIKAKMALSDALKRRVRARPEEDDDMLDMESSEAASDESVTAESDQDLEGASDGSDLSDAASQSGSEAESEDGEEEEEEQPSDNPDINSTLAQISFGALAKAQDSLGSRSKLKRNRSAMDEEDDGDDEPDGGRRRQKRSSNPNSPLDDIRARIRAAKEEKERAASKLAGKDKERGGPPKEKIQRSSKHAPAVQSSKHAVSRRRMVVDAANNLPVKARDPRFDGTVASYSLPSKNQTKAAPKPHPSLAGVGNKNYAFLDEYRASELAALRAQMVKTKNPEEKEELNKTITSMKDRQRAYNQRQKEREVVAEHRQKERELIREGKKGKAWFMKKGDVKKEVLKKRYEEMGSRERQKGLERRRKKIASKERKNMPDARRGAMV